MTNDVIVHGKDSIPILRKRDADAPRKIEIAVLRLVTDDGLWDGG